MYPVDFEARLEDARSRKNGAVNCIGATLYLLGIDEKEKCVDPRWSRARIIRSFSGIGTIKDPQAEYPEKCIAVGIYSNKYQTLLHTGVVLPSRDAIVQRSAYGEPLEVISLKDLIKSYRPQDFIEYGASMTYLAASGRQSTNWEKFTDKLHEWKM